MAEALDPATVAIRVYMVTVEKADREMEAAIEAARAKHDRVEEEARAACQSVLDAHSPEGIKITIGRVSDAEEPATP